MTKWFLDRDISQFSDSAQLAMLEHVQALNGILLLREYDPELTLNLKRFPNLHVLNLFDWLCGLKAVDKFKLRDIRVNSPMDKRFNVLEITDGKPGSLAIDRGNVVAKLKTGRWNQLKEIDYYDKHDRLSMTETYDVRGFLSRTVYYNLDGNVGHELYYREDGSVGLEIAYMQVNNTRVTTYHVGDVWFSSLDDLTNWWLKSLVKDQDTLFVERIYLAHTVHDVLGKHYLVPHVKPSSKWTDNVKVAINNYDNVIVNYKDDMPLMQAQLGKAMYLPELISPIKLNAELGNNKPKMVTAFGLLIEPKYVERVAKAFNILASQQSDIKLQLVGYFTNVTKKMFYNQLKKEYRSRVIDRGYLTGVQRDQALQNSSVVWWLAREHNNSNLGPDIIALNNVPGLGQENDASLYLRVSANTGHLIQQTLSILTDGVNHGRVERLHQEALNRQQQALNQWNAL